MVIIEQVARGENDSGVEVPRFRVQCEDCEETGIVSSWRHTITPQRRCGSCGKVRKPRGAVAEAARARMLRVE